MACDVALIFARHLKLGRGIAVVNRRPAPIRRGVMARYINNIMKESVKGSNAYIAAPASPLLPTRPAAAGGWYQSAEGEALSRRKSAAAAREYNQMALPGIIIVK